MFMTARRFITQVQFMYYNDARFSHKFPRFNDLQAFIVACLTSNTQYREFRKAYKAFQKKARWEMRVTRARIRELELIAQQRLEGESI